MNIFLKLSKIHVMLYIQKSRYICPCNFVLIFFIIGYMYIIRREFVANTIKWL